MKPSFRLKRLSGWFAAGPEFERALKLLSERDLQAICLRLPCTPTAQWSARL